MTESRVTVSFHTGSWSMKGHTLPDFYWKRTFLETSPGVYHYLESENTVYVDQYVKDRWGNGAMAAWIKVSFCLGAVDLLCTNGMYAWKAGIKQDPRDVFVALERQSIYI